MSKNKIPHQILIKESELNNTNDYPVDNPMNTSNSDEKISIIDEFQLDMNKSRNNCFKNIFACCFPCFSNVDTKSKRVVGFRDKTYNVTNWSNKVENNKYNIILFLPTVIYNQFKQFGNFFYLVMAISQFIPDIKVGFLFAYVSPLCVVVIVSLLKELADDINRRIQDFKTNSTKVTVIQFVKNKKSSSKELKKIKKTYSNLKVGDIIELNKDERIPADIVVLKTYNESEDSNTFIRTDQLDGETDWKLRKAPGITQKLNEYQILTLNGYINYEPPSKFIYNFEGFISVKNDEGNIIKESLGLENTMWESTILATKKIIGIVIYTGKETRARMNSALPKIKLGIVDHELNMVTFYLFCIMLLAAMFLTSLKGYYSRVFFTFFKFIVLFCAIIPIALRVNLVISKTFFSVRINKDKSVPETIARNSTIPEELGRISYIFSDKTGTLTKNEMIFKNIEMETEQFSQESFNDLKDILEDECKTNDAPLLDVYNKLKKEKEINEDNDNDIDDNNLINNNINTNTNKNKNKKDILIDEDSNDSIHDEKKEKKSHNQKKKSKRVRRSRNKIIKDTITSMLLCNNVTPIISNEDPNIISYQASSPDEIALVKFAEKLSMKLIYRTDKQIKIKNTSGTIEEYTILANFPFSSETKRMGIILQNKKYGHIIFYLKGAENVMMKFVKKEYVGYIQEKTENLATKGLRTLVLTQKLISEKDFTSWFNEYSQALTSMENRKEKLRQVISKLENNMEFLCVTGVEDLLQDEVATTIENLRNAGIKLWMLTGDKVETATCISISAGLKAKNHKIFTLTYDQIKDEENKDNEIINLKEKLNEYNNKILIDPHLLIIDGDILDLSLKYCQQEFYSSAMQAPSVVCCRCSPTQKRLIVSNIKKYTHGRTAAVGDGGNDVAMIQEGDVGIGIVGKEGLQASLASDFSIKEFKSLNILILWWGRIAYKNTSTMANFIVHRGLIIAFCQFFFSLMFYYNPVPLYNGFLTFGFSTIFTSLPIISILLDQDVDKRNVINFPNLYKILLKGREINLKNFLWWLFKAIIQASIIMFGSFFMFPDKIFLKIVTCSFTALVYLEILNIYTEINKLHWFMIISLLGTCIVYTLTLAFLNNYLDIYFVIQKDIFWKIIVIAIIAWMPFFITNKIKKHCFPQEYDKVNEE
jgi:phospholipid-translocating ATPase